MAWQDDEEQDDEQYEDETEDAEEQEEEPELPAETQALLERERQKARDEATAQFRAAAQKRGMAFTGDDLAVADFQQFHTSFGQVAASQQQQERRVPDDAEQPDEMPDPSYDAAGFAAWMQRRDERLIQRTVASLKPEFDTLRGSLSARDQVDVALENARTILTERGMGHFVDHPEFDRLYRDGLLTELRPEQWNNPRALGALAGAIAEDLKERGGFQQQRRSRDESGRFAREDQRRMLEEIGASRSGGRGMRAPEPTRVERQLASAAGQLFGMDAEEWAASEDETGQALKALHERRAKAGRSR